MHKAVRLGDLIFVRNGDDFSVSHLYPNSSSKRFKLTESNITGTEVRRMGVDPETGAATNTEIKLHLAPGEDYWCLILIDVLTREPVRSLGKVRDEVVSNVLLHRTAENTHFPEVSYEDLRRVKRVREENLFRARTISHMDDTRAIRELLVEILAELRKTPSATAAAKKPRATRKVKPTEDASPDDGEES